MSAPVAIVLAAIPWGLAISVSPGAALFGIIQTSLSKGFRSGIFFAMGIAISDAIFIALCLWGLSSVMDNPLAIEIFGFICGGLLIGYGLYTFLSKHEKVSDKQRQQVEERMNAIEERQQAMDERVQEMKGKIIPQQRQLKARINFIKPFSKGFLFNLINPCAWVLWLAILPTTVNFQLRGQILFFSAILCTIFCIDMLKSYFAGRIKKIITPKMFFIINRVIGIIFCVLGIFMMVKMTVLAH